MTSRGSSFLSLPLALALALAPACRSDEDHKHGPEIRIDAERYRVPLFGDDTKMGGDAPLVTIVLFTDYACPPCGATWTVMDNLVEDYGQDVRVVFRSYTVPGFERGEQAAEAAFAAGAQGKFWEMHRRMFEQPGALDRASLRAHAEALGLDVPRFTDDLDTGVHTGIRTRHRREATRLGIQGLPAAFVNGLFVSGFADEATWHGIVDGEIARAKEMLAAGTPRAELYDAVMANASTGRVTPLEGADELEAELAKKQAENEPPKELRAPKSDARYRVDDAGAVARGPADAPVMVVEFVDLKCPFCRRAWTEELEATVKAHGDDVRFVLRHLPLPIHPEANGAAKAVLAAERQGKGKGWAMHESIIEHEGSVGRSNFVEFAKALGLDDQKFLADLDDPEIAKAVDADVALANRLGVNGTPGFFVNGRYVSGFAPGQVRGMIDEELARAKALVAKGTKKAEVRTALMAGALGPEEFPNP